jgi:hypothetical protein
MRFKMLDNPRHADRWECLCLVCDHRFFVHSNSFSCPRCKNNNHEEVVPVHVEEDPRADQYVLRSDLGEGD